MSITELHGYDLHTKDWGFLPNAIMQQVSGPRCMRAAGAAARALARRALALRRT